MFFIPGASEHTSKEHNIGLAAGLGVSVTFIIIMAVFITLGYCILKKDLLHKQLSSQDEPVIKYQTFNDDVEGVIKKPGLDSINTVTFAKEAIPNSESNL